MPTKVIGFEKASLNIGVDLLYGERAGLFVVLRDINLHGFPLLLKISGRFTASVSQASVSASA
jgi:hypothetical protein